MKCFKEKKGMVLGLDMGTNSLGWALIDTAGEVIIDSGVRIFPMGVENLGKGDKEQSKSSQRTEFRGIRRQTRRRKQRKKQFSLFLTEINLKPKQIDEKFELSDTAYPGELTFNDIDPYHVRNKAVHHKLEPYELGRALIHICTRRGYIDIGKATDDEAAKKKETGAIFKGTDEKPGINMLNEALKLDKYKTLGEYLYSVKHSLESNGTSERVRNRYTDRQMYLDEFNIIWEKQREFYPDILTEENYKKARCLIFFQKPLRSQKKNVGICTFESNVKMKIYKRNCPKSAPLAQHARMLQQVNNFSVMGEDRKRKEDQQLSAFERGNLIEYLSKHPKMDFKKSKATLIKTLGLKPKGRYKTSHDSQGKLDGLKTLSSFRKVLGKKLDQYSEDDIYKLWHLIYSEPKTQKKIDVLMNKWNFDKDIATRLAKVHLEPGYANLSAKALKKIFPFLEEGMLYNEACDAVGYDHSLYVKDEEREYSDLLPIPPRIKNPIVQMGLNQLRHIVNGVIERYGHPEAIHIELGRDLKNNRIKRQEIEKDNRERQKDHDNIIQRLKEEFGDDYPRKDAIIKYKLWRECNQTCPYTGKSIGIRQLYNGEVDIEHILPYSRSLDNSFMNKTLCFRSENQAKGNKTPFEAYGHDKAKFSGILERVKNFNFRKARKFQQEELDDDFLSSQLNDTRYMSREAMKYLMPVTCQVVPVKGNTTSYLRRYWGLNSVLSQDINNMIKNREDHRHHAVDAIVIAMTTRSALQKLSTYHALNYNLEEAVRKNFEKPWENFRDDAAESIANIIVSFKKNGKPQGQLHKESMYGKLYNPDGTERLDIKGQNLFAIRKKIETLSHKEVTQIIDPVVKSIVYDRLEAFGLDTNKLKESDKSKISKAIKSESLYFVGPKSGKAVPIKSVRIQKPFTGAIQLRDYNVWVEIRNNHHVVIYKEIDSGKQKGEVITLIDTAKRYNQKLKAEAKQAGEEVLVYEKQLSADDKALLAVDKQLDPGKEYITWLQINDMILFGKLPDNAGFEDKSTYKYFAHMVYRVQKIAQSTQLNFRLNNVAVLKAKDKEKKMFEPGSLQQNAGVFNGQKIKISPIGFIEYDYD